nr:hypothetical protein [Mycolicibacter kumamotonensis]
MPGRFNPPPGWPVQSDWEPPTDWEPDPAWPPAPPGWQFWIDDQPERLESSTQPDHHHETQLRLTGWETLGAPMGVGQVVAQDRDFERESGDQAGALRRNNPMILAIIIGFLVAAVLAPVIGWLTVQYLHRGDATDDAANGPNNAAGTDSQWTTIPSKTPVASAALDGVYRVDLNFAERQINGVLDPAPNRQAWWAYRSVCKPTGCVATATMLDANLNQNTGSPASTDVFRFLGDHWEDPPTPYPGHVSCPGGGSAAVTLLGHSSWYPQPDGTFHGVQVADVQTPTCGAQGQAFLVPFTATRIGDVPPGVSVADPALVGG